MSDQSESFIATASVPAYRVVTIATVADGQRRCSLHLTDTSLILGLSQDTVVTNGSVPVETRYGMVSKGQCGASVSAGSLVGPQTATGSIVQATASDTTTTAIPKTVGIALESGSTNSVIQILLQPNNGSN